MNIDSFIDKMADSRYEQRQLHRQDGKYSKNSYRLVKDLAMSPGTGIITYRYIDKIAQYSGL